MKTQIYFYMFFVMLYTCILDDSIKSLTLILTADHPTLLFLPGFFYKIKNFFFSFVGEHLHDPPPFNGQFFMTPPFSAVSKNYDPSSVSTPLPPLTSVLLNRWGTRHIHSVSVLLDLNFRAFSSSSFNF